MSRCYSCFKEFEDRLNVCPYCGSVVISEPVEANQLCPGTVLGERYIIGTAVGSGGFGIIYKAWDTKLETLIAIKEFFVSRLVTRATGEKEVIVNKKSSEEFQYRKTRFLAEARNMAKFGAHRSIPNVFEFFEENNTAYIVMELLEGINLNKYLAQNGGKINKDFAVFIVNEIGNALTSLHEKGIIHRDVAPDNIYICSDKEIRIKLLDLGAAKLADTDDDVVDIILKPGYSPPEQYENTTNVGPWMDIYALGATMYMMLTGTKPDESTNRKISDTVVYPDVLDETIPENLSNTIMKAMAIEKHLRFKSVNDFLKAINGEKTVVTLVKEKKRRRYRRFTGIIAACLAIVCAFFSVHRSYLNKKNEQTLNSAKISIWYSVDYSENEQLALESIVTDFKSKFENVDVELVGYPKEEYASAIQKAYESNTLPTLFESTGLSSNIINSSANLNNVLNSEQAKNCLFLKQYYNYYSNSKQLPLGIEIPVAFVITNGSSSISYDGDYFEKVNDFGETVNVSANLDYKGLIENNFGISNLTSSEEFLNIEKNTSPVMLSSSMDINNVKALLQNYEKKTVFYKADKIKCNFTYEWSIGKGSEDEIKAAERMLSWMLGNSYQNTLMLSRCSDGQIPINETCFKAWVTQKDMMQIDELDKNFIFEK